MRRVVERAREHADRLEQQRVRDGVQFPESEMARDEEHALALPVGEPHAILAVAPRRARASARGESVLNFSVSNGLRDEMRERRADDRAALGGRTRRKRRGQVGVGDAAARAVDRVPREAERARRRARSATRASRRQSPRAPARRRIRASVSLRSSRQPQTFEEPRPELIGRLDGRRERDGGDRQIRQIAGREPHRVLVGRQHDRGRGRSWRPRRSARRRARELMMIAKRHACRRRAIPPAVRSEKNRSGRAMPAVANTRECLGHDDGVAGLAPCAAARAGASRERRAGRPSARPTRSAAGR